MKIRYFLLLLVALGLGGCATIEGIGEDLESAGEALQEEAEEADGE